VFTAVLGIPGSVRSLGFTTSWLAIIRRDITRQNRVQRKVRPARGVWSGPFHPNSRREPSLSFRSLRSGAVCPQNLQREKESNDQRGRHAEHKRTPLRVKARAIAQEYLYSPSSDGSTALCGQAAKPFDRMNDANNFSEHVQVVQMEGLGQQESKRS
jgi:hypothetical protein